MNTEVLRNFCKLHLFLILAALPVLLNASHLVGGSMSYRYVGANGNGTYRYQVTLKIYRDCNASATPFDPTIQVGAYEENSSLFLYNAFVFSLLSETDVKPPQGSNCPGTVSVCIKEGTYSQNIDLPSSNAGYHLIFQRCCRNTQKNLADSMGQTYYAFVPPTSTVNSSPYFSGVPAPYICVGDTTTYLNGAVDPDGDSLSYELVHPWAGGTGFVPVVTPSTVLSLPIVTSNYRNGYNVTNPFGVNGLASIDVTNGLTTMYSPATGLYSIAIEVTEWRNGIKLSSIRRDVQIISITCTPNQIPSIFPTTGTFNKSVIAGETICFDVRATDADNPGQRVKISARGEVFGNESTWQGPKATFKTDSAISGITSQFCWATSCDQGRTALYNFVVDAIDDGCPPKSRSVTFTIEVKKFPGTISFGGPNQVCEDDTGITYFTPGTVGSKYKWEITGGTITSPDSLNSIKVNWNTKGWGKLKLVETNKNACVSPTYEYVIEKGGYPAPVIITPDTICEFTSKQYDITAPTNGSTYNWSVAGGTIVSQPQNHQALINWAKMGTGLINIVETNKYGCVGDTNKSFVEIVKPLTDSIYGSQSVCPHIRGVEYRAFPTRPEAIYRWFIEGGDIVAGDSTGTITVNWGPAGTGTIKAIETLKWGCTGDTFGISIIKNHVLQGFKPVGEDTLCEFTPGIPYEVVYTKGSDYFWSINGGTIVRDDTTHSIVADWGKFGNAQVSVYEISYDSINNIPCIGAPVSLDVFLPPIPTADEINDRFKICEGETGVMYNINGFNGSTYKWLVNNDSTNVNGQGTSSIRYDAAAVGLFPLSVTETSQYGCVGNPVDTNIRVTPKPRTKPIAGDTIVCYPYFTERTYASGGNPGSVLHWFFDGGTIDSGNTTPTVYLSFNGQKYNLLKVVEVTDEGCIGDTLYKNVFADRPYLTIRYVSVGFPDNFMQIAWQLDSAPFYAYDFAIERRAANSNLAWRTAGTVSGSVFNFNDTNLNTDNNAYEYRIRGKNLCGSNFFSPTHTNVFLTGKQDAETFETPIEWTNYRGWDNGVSNYEIYRRNDDTLLPYFSRMAGLDTVVVFDDAFANYIQRYRIMATEAAGGAVADTSWSNEIELKLIPVLWVPNAFTPNHDGLNNVFEIVSGSIKSFEIEIYDRWGSLIFKSDDVHRHWDGRINGIEVPDGVFVYRLKYSGGDNISHIRKGNITIMH